MGLAESLQDIAGRIVEHGSSVETEEATKNAFIMPFIASLGYDVFNPKEVVPEFTADVGTKKGEKVDYAVIKDGKIILLFECKKLSADLHKEHASQLFRYFATTEARFGVLTNGSLYQFYSDIDEANKMDSKPFFEFDMLDFDDNDIEELKKFSKSAFSLDEILTSASTLKYTGGILKVLEQEMSNPSDELVRFFASKVYDGVLRQNVIEEFRKIVVTAQKKFINDKVNGRLKSALSAGELTQADNEMVDEEQCEMDDSGIDTTQDEIDGFNIVRAIIAGVVDIKRVHMRDTKSYCGVLLDNNNRKPICRLHFNAKQKYLEIGNCAKSSDRVPIESIDEIFKYSSQLQGLVRSYVD